LVVAVLSPLLVVVLVAACDGSVQVFFGGGGDAVDGVQHSIQSDTRLGRP
jgi:hypothetical protein